MSDALATAPSATVRSYEDDDAPAAAALLREVAPDFLVNATLLEHWRRNTPERARQGWWVAEADGAIVGWGEAELRWSLAEPDVGWIWVGVRKDHRRRGLGGALHGLAERHLRESGARTLQSMLVEDADEFALRLGYRVTRHERLSRLDVRTVDLGELDRLEEAKRREGSRLAPLAELLARPHDLLAMYGEAHADMPSDHPYGTLAFDEWRRETLENPLLDRDASMNVLFGDRPVAFAWLVVDREGRRGEHELTGTLREFRGRGLARLAKLAAVRWCAENGDTLLTGNDSTNAPMFAINDRLGYAPTVVRAEVAREL